MSLLAVTNARVVNGITPPGEPRTILVGADGLIANTDAGSDIPASAVVVDAAGRSVLPGLIDAHIHIYAMSMIMDEINRAPLSYIALKGSQRLAGALRRGFTTLRDVAGGDIGLDRAIKEGVIPSPRLLYTGPAISQTGGHGDGRNPHYEMHPDCGCLAMSVICDGADAIRAKVRDLLRTGSCGIKLMVSGGVASPTDPIMVTQLSPEEIQAATYEANRRGAHVAAHAYPPEAIKLAVENGVRTIEHANLIDVEAAKAVAAAGAYIIPTLVTYDAMNRRGDEVRLTPESAAKNTVVLEAGKEAIRIARAAGCKIGWGSDLMGDLEDEELAGLRLQAEVEGIERTIEAATATNAEAIQRPDLGKIEVGRVGDLLILDGDVLADPALLWDETKTRTVIQGGKVVSCAPAASQPQ
ncbi:MAG: amidohydrolase family protein [Propionibacteriaceae bacterium]|jgi:imidazolonepropionase-like amidohydrolase|nr:amidohydrolase family protein [Propionibacteriaceae bacterium]